MEEKNEKDRIKDIENNNDDDNKLRPFEWLTSAQSILPRLEKLLLDSMKRKKWDDECSFQILHLGCGSSILGELLATSSVLTDVSCIHVVNVDRDRATIQRMQHRWSSITTMHGKSVGMSFHCLDLSQRDSLLSCYPDESFDLVVDKSTLDCLLCTETAASVMITQVYRCLKPGGRYFIISFHEIEFLKPLLQDMPGFDWHIRCDRMERSVEDLIQTTMSSDHKIPFEQLQQQQHDGNIANNRRFANILECQKRSQHNTRHIDYEAVQRHVETVSNRYYSLHNPLLTTERKRQIQFAFEKNPNMDLETCYHVLFDDHVRAHLDYEEFLDDWKTFCEIDHTWPLSACTGNNREKTRETMDYETAIAFLEKMQ
jgi:SAM-dependent methyltransferase